MAKGPDCAFSKNILRKDQKKKEVKILTEFLLSNMLLFYS